MSKDFFVGVLRGSICHAPCPPHAQTNALALALATMLKERYDVTDPAELKELTAKALKAIRDNM